MQRTRLAALLLVGIACAGELPTERPLARHTFSGTTMGTTYTVTVVARSLDDGRLASLRASIAASLEAVDATMSHYRPDSELSRFNQSRETTPVPVSRGMVAVVMEALEISRETGGAFDVTIAPLVDAWGFGAPGAVDAAPTRATIALLRQDVGYRHLAADDADSTLRKLRPGVRLDLSAIAKGHGVDRAVLALAAAGFTDYLVEVGGEIRLRGGNENGAPWRIAIERPRPDTSVAHRVLGLTDQALATSGDYRNFYDLEGVRVSHTIDPRSGRPVTHRLRSVSVLADRCARADGLATALEVLGPDDGYALALERGWAALFVVEDEDGTLRDRSTPAFDAIGGGPPG